MASALRIVILDDPLLAEADRLSLAALSDAVHPPGSPPNPVTAGLEWTDATIRAMGWQDGRMVCHVGALVRARVATGASLASISREAGLHKDWLSRHLATVDPAVAEEVTDHRSRRHRSADARWLPTVRRLGFDTVPAYLADRHVAQRRTIGAMARELGLPRAAVESALARHDIAHVPHATSRARREERRAELAERFGHPTFAAYVTDRRAAGLSWRAIAAECGQPEIWVRRQAGAAR